MWSTDVNIAKTSKETRNFLSADVFVCFSRFEILKFSPRGLFLFLELRLKAAGFHFRKYKRSFLWGKYQESFLLRKYENFFNIRARKFHSQKEKELFSGGSFFSFFFFIGLRSVPGGSYIYYYNQLQQTIPVHLTTFICW